MAVATKAGPAKSKTGEIVQIIGPVLDVRFEEGELPEIYQALTVKRDDGELVVAEVQQHLGNNWVRAVSMQTTDGLRRGMKATNTGGPITVPVGKEALGRVFCGVGERSREGTQLLGEMRESGVMDKMSMVFGQMNEPPGARLRVALTGLTIAEYFRDVEGRDLLIFIDNIFRFTQAGSEVSALLGRMPSAVGYQPTLATEMGELQERITSTKKGSITSLQAVFVPADDYTDPSSVTTFAHLDAS